MKKYLKFTLLQCIVVNIVNYYYGAAVGTEKQDCPTCFGKAKSCGLLPACLNCVYNESCQYVVAHPVASGSKRDKRGHHVSVEQYQYAAEIAAEESPFFDDPDPDDYEKPIYSNADMQHMLEFFLRGVDDYSLAIIECILREKHFMASQVAKAFGVSREAMHRKLIDSCKKYPILSEMLRTTLYRCKRLSDPANRASIAGRRKKGVDTKSKVEKQKEFQW